MEALIQYELRQEYSVTPIKPQIYSLKARVYCPRAFSFLKNAKNVFHLMASNIYLHSKATLRMTNCQELLGEIFIRLHYETQRRGYRVVIFMVTLAWISDTG